MNCERWTWSSHMMVCLLCTDMAYRIPTDIASNFTVL
jgi:hypothetical protein